MSDTAAALSEIRALLHELPGPDLAAATAARERQAQLALDGADLGRLGDAVVWLATWQGRGRPDMRHPRVSVFAANHGVAVARANNADPLAETAAMVAGFVEGGSPVNQACLAADADLRVYEMDLESPTADFTVGDAMDEEECVRAMAYGMMAVEPGLHLLVLGDAASGNAASGGALAAGLLGGDPADWLDGATSATVQAARDGLARHGDEATDALDLLRRLGGQETAAMAGAILAARLARTPVLVDSLMGLVVVAVLRRLDPRAVDHVMVADTTPATVRLADALGKEPLSRFGIGGTPGLASTLAISLLKGALAAFDKAG